MDIVGKVEGWFERGEKAPAAEPVAAAQAPSQAAAATGGGAAPTATIPHRTLLIHGYSASGKEFAAWKAALGAKGVPTATIEIGNYISLNNEITIKDLGEAFDRALRLTKWSDGSKDDRWTFDAIVHSTGMLVVRQWLASDPFDRSDERSRLRRLKHLVGLAPATFGSPQGKQGRSWLGALVKGNKDFGPDFLNAGDKVLDGLELGSKYTWDLAMMDLLCDAPFYDQGNQTPYVAVFIGNLPYSGLARAASGPGTDGTVRWAGCGLDSRMVRLDFRREPKLVDEQGQATRAKMSPWSGSRLAVPMLAVDGRNHGTILSDPEPGVVDRVSKFILTVNSTETYGAWFAEAEANSKSAQARMNDASAMNDDSLGKKYGGAGWQQFVFHVVDDHGDGLTDYNVQLFVGESMEESDKKEFPAQPVIADAYSRDASFRCFYVRLDDEMLAVGTAASTKRVWIELIASSGTAYLDYEAYYNQGDALPDANVKKMTPLKIVDDPQTAMPNVVKLDLSHIDPEATLFTPYTTTLVEITLEREPTPLAAVSSIFQFWQGSQNADIK